MLQTVFSGELFFFSFNTWSYSTPKPTDKLRVGHLQCPHTSE